MYIYLAISMQYKSIPNFIFKGRVHCNWVIGAKCREGRTKSFMLYRLGFDCFAIHGFVVNRIDSSHIFQQPFMPNHSCMVAWALSLTLMRTKGQLAFDWRILSLIPFLLKNQFKFQFWSIQNNISEHESILKFWFWIFLHSV